MNKSEQAADMAKSILESDLLKFISSQIAKDTEAYTSKFMAQKVANLEPAFLAKMIETNKVLTDMQKTQIMHILETPHEAGTCYN